MCDERKDPLTEPGGPVHYFIAEAVCMGCFTIEFVLRMFASPATIGHVSGDRTPPPRATADQVPSSIRVCCAASRLLLLTHG